MFEKQHFSSYFFWNWTHMTITSNLETCEILTIRNKETVKGLTAKKKEEKSSEISQGKNEEQKLLEYLIQLATAGSIFGKITKADGKFDINPIFCFNVVFSYYSTSRISVYAI